MDAYGLFPGNALQTADGEQAYIQAPLGGIKGGVKTSARLPRDMWPDSFKGLKDPVVPVLSAIYGHPQSGGIGRSTAGQRSTRRDGTISQSGHPCTGIPSSVSC